MIVTLKCSNKTLLWKITSQLETTYSTITGPELMADDFIKATQIILYLSKVDQFSDDITLVTSSSTDITMMIDKMPIVKREILLEMMNQCKPCKPSYIINLTSLTEEIDVDPAIPTFQIMANNPLKQIAESIIDALNEIETHR